MSHNIPDTADCLQIKPELRINWFCWVFDLGQSWKKWGAWGTLKAFPRNTLDKNQSKRGLSQDSFPFQAILPFQMAPFMIFTWKYLRLNCFAFDRKRNGTMTNFCSRNALALFSALPHCHLSYVIHSQTTRPPTSISLFLWHYSQIAC